jgi:hypothetical protein
MRRKSVCCEPNNTRLGGRVCEGAAREIPGAGAMAPWIGGRSSSVSGRSRATVVCDCAGPPREVYHNVVVSLDRAKDINNGQPSALGRWIDSLALKRGERVYHLGCGVGYYTAIIAEVVGLGGRVVVWSFSRNWRNERDRT